MPCSRLTIAVRSSRFFIESIFYVSYFLTDNVAIQLTLSALGIGPPFHHWNMAKYVQRSCPKCDGYLGIVVPERKAKMPVQAINGRCLKCGYRLTDLSAQRSKAR